jgi:hypothetical protein
MDKTKVSEHFTEHDLRAKCASDAETLGHTPVAGARQWQDYRAGVSVPAQGHEAVMQIVQKASPSLFQEN